MSSVESNKPLSTLVTGCVKWFNNSLNYGFITVLTECEFKNKDIFCHQSNIKTKQECFRTLYTGECVQFEITKSDNDKHPYHGINITGFNEGMLHCENPSYYLNNNRDRGDRGSDRNSSSRGSSRGGSRGSMRGSMRGSSRGGSRGISSGNSSGNSSGKDDVNQNIDFNRKKL